MLGTVGLMALRSHRIIDENLYDQMHQTSIYCILMADLARHASLKDERSRLAKACSNRTVSRRVVIHRGSTTVIALQDL